MKLELNMATLKALVPVLEKAQPYVYGLLLVGVFAYTAYSVNLALNVQAAASQTAIAPLPKITFDKATIDSLKNRTPVDGSVPVDLGATDPF